MKKNIFLIIVMLILTIFLVAGQQNLDKTFKAKKQLTIYNVSGDCEIRTGSNSEIVVKLVYTYKDSCYQPEFKETDTELIIKEKFVKNNCRGESSWVILVPKNIDVNFNSASGDFTLDGVKGNISVNTASGDIEVSNTSGTLKVNTASGHVTARALEGKIKLNTASGDLEAKKLSGKIMMAAASGNVMVTDSKGGFKMTAASGDVTAGNILCTAPCHFAAASGDVEVSLTKTAEFDLDLAAASGDVTLNYRGNKIVGEFVFIARKGRGDISAPFKFDTEEVVKKYNKEYDKKSFKRGNSSPKISLMTSSGTAELVK